MCSPPVGSYKLQSKLLAELKTFDKHGSLRHVETTITRLSGEKIKEELFFERTDQDEEANCLAMSLKKMALMDKFTGKDKTPCRVIDGLYIGSMSAAHNLKALRKRGITHILNASPIVPCYFKDSPHQEFKYMTVNLFDDTTADLLSHVEATNTFIEQGLKAGGGVFVHCYAGQSRSAALIIAYLIGRQDLDLPTAWSTVRRARPCALPNSGFLQQLGSYEMALRDSKCVSYEIFEQDNTPAVTASVVY